MELRIRAIKIHIDIEYLNSDYSPLNPDYRDLSWCGYLLSGCGGEVLLSSFVQMTHVMSAEDRRDAW
jgi:hypothetical protein